MKGLRKKSKNASESDSQIHQKDQENSTSAKSSTQNISSHNKFIFPKEKPKLVEIIWVDAETVGDAHWMPNDDSKEAARSPLPIMMTVGYVLWENEEMISVTNTIGPDETAQVNKIPKKMIYNIDEL